MMDKTQDATEIATKTFVGKVEKIISAGGQYSPEKAQFSVEGAEDLYGEIRVKNELQDKAGNPVALKKGAEVEVTIAAATEATTTK
jgi:hypothetical protein